MAWGLGNIAALAAMFSTVPSALPTAGSVTADGYGCTWVMNGFTSPGTLSVERYTSILCDDGMSGTTGFTEDWASIASGDAEDFYRAVNPDYGISDTHADDLIAAGTYSGLTVISVSVDYRVVFTGDGTVFASGSTTSSTANVSRPV